MVAFTHRFSAAHCPAVCACRLQVAESPTGTMPWSALAVLPISRGGSRSLSRLTMEYGDFESTAEPRCAHLSVIYRAITATSCKPLRRQRWRRQMMAAAASISSKQKFRYVITSRLFEICVLAFQNVLNFQNPFRCRRVVSCLRWKLEIPWCQS